MQKTKITVTGEIELSYDENSKEFIEAFEGYKECMSKRAKKEEMLQHVAFYITRFGIDSMVEGVGYVGYNGTKPSEDPYSGIMVSEDYDDFTFEIE